MGADIPLSPRLKTVLSLTPRADCCCDIGTDHGYLAAALAKRGGRVIAADVNAAPLASAERNLRRFGAANAETRLSDGLSAIAEGEADCAVLAGMGGDLIRRVISAGIKGTKWLVLQPQSLVYELRGFLCESGFAIVDEALCREGGRFYAAMLVTRGDMRLNEAQLRLGPALMAKRPPLFAPYVEDEMRKLRLALEKIRQNGADTENAAEYRRLLALYGGVLHGEAERNN